MTTRTKTLLTGASILATAFASSGAYAAGTASGVSISNTATVAYTVGGVAQTPRTATVAFLVDRRITFTLSELGTVTTSVGPGQNAAVTTFTVANTTNATLDFGFSVAQQANGVVAVHGGTDNFDVTSVSVFADSNANGVYDAGTDLAIFADEVLADTSRTVFVVASIPIGQVTNDVAGVVLTAQAREGGVASTQGAIVVATAGADTAAVDTVFADTSGATDANRDGLFSARDDYTVSAAALTVTKTSRIISDPVNLAVNPKNIPGAILEYCIQVTNASGSAVANGVAISDPVPTETTFIAGSIFVGGTITGAVCSGGAATGSYTGTTVSGTIATIPAGSTSTLYFRTTIN